MFGGGPLPGGFQVRLQAIEASNDPLALGLGQPGELGLRHRAMARVDQDAVLGELLATLTVGMLRRHALAFLAKFLLRRRPLDFGLDAGARPTNLLDNRLGIVRQDSDGIRNKALRVIHVRVAVGTQDCECAHLRRQLRAVRAQCRHGGIGQHFRERLEHDRCSRSQLERTVGHRGAERGRAAWTGRECGCATSPTSWFSGLSSRGASGWTSSRQTQRTRR
jgi:hypothetical protein